MKKCESTTVEVVKEIMVNNVKHAGVMTHRCDREEGHKDWCCCACGHQWPKFGNVK